MDGPDPVWQPASDDKAGAFAKGVPVASTGVNGHSCGHNLIENPSSKILYILIIKDILPSCAIATLKTQ